MASSDPLFVTHFCQSVFGVLFALALGSWMTVSAIRVVREPSYVSRRTIANWMIRMAATHSSLMRGHYAFWAWMMLAAGLAGDLVAVLGLAATIGWLVRTML